jgi:hypothetical protein
MTPVLTGTLGSYAQQLHRRPAPAASAPYTDLLSRMGLRREASHPARLFILEQLRPSRPADAFIAHSMFMPDPSTSEELEALGTPTSVVALRRETRWPPSELTAEPVVSGPRREPPAESDVQPLVMAVKALIESERIVAARQILDATPAAIAANPVVVKLRAILAPPAVKRVDRRDVDRSQEYRWLRTEGLRHRGRWVALDGDQLVASAATLRELRETLKALPLSHTPLLHRVD